MTLVCGWPLLEGGWNIITAVKNASMIEATLALCAGIHRIHSPSHSEIAMSVRPLGIAMAVASSIAVMGAGAFRQSPAPFSRYLYIWAGTGTMKKDGIDMIAVVDANPSSPKYGRVVNALTVSRAGRMPHHSEFQLPNRGPLFVNDFGADKSFLIDFRDAGHPRLAAQVMAVPHAHGAHSFAKTPNGHTLATIQFGDGTTAGNPGGLGEFNNNGKLLRFTSSVDPAFAGAKIRTYALTTLPKIDRIVTTSSPMDTETTADVVQVWRMSDLKLLKTLALPKVETDSASKYPFEVRTLADGRTVLMNTYYCGFYRISGIERDAKIERVMVMQHPKNIGCSVPIIAGKFMVMPIAYAHRYATIDISDPAHPVEVQSLATDSTFYPHWIAAEPGTDRVVVTDQGDGAPMLMLGHFDSRTGKLWWDEKFRDAGSAKPGVSFMKDVWPNGVKGMAMPHGAVFVH